LQVLNRLPAASNGRKERSFGKSREPFGGEIRLMA
jgi:hypothetical protein